MALRSENACAIEHGSDEVASRVLSPLRTLRWLVILRWHAVAAQVVLVTIARVMLGHALPVLAMQTVVGVVAGSNALLQRHVRRQEGARYWIVGVLLLDVLALTTLLALGRGGSTTPLALAYLVLVLVSALALTPWRALAVLVFACVCYALLLVLDEGPATVHRQATWLSFAATGGVVTAVVTRFATALREQWVALEAAKALATRARTLASLGNLAAGAAHELNTPLGTIAILANELPRVIEADPAQAVDDAYVIREEIDRCRAILQRLAARPGEHDREEPVVTTGDRIRTETTAMLPYGEAGRVHWSMPPGDEIFLPREGLAQTLASLVTNALHASKRSRERVVVTMESGRTTVRFTVADRGTGISEKIRSRLGEPFVTTKPPGEGMGLGIFLCQSFADAWNASLQFEDNPGGGARVVLDLPRPGVVEEGAA